ncbi:MAG: DUF692 domain-containing protein [Bacteroidota bacterium]
MSLSGTPRLRRDALGVGLRPSFYPEIAAADPVADYFEIITENYLHPGSPPARALERIQARFPIVLHGVTLNLLGHAPLDGAYVGDVAALAERVRAPFVTDHLCWTGAHGVNHHDLLPTPYVPELVDLAAARARQVQAAVGRPFGIENLSTYAAFRRSSMTEWEFYGEVVRQSGCWFMLDINNVFVSSVNHAFDPKEYLRSIDYSRVLQVHLAGHTVEPDGTIIDTHDKPVADAVWDLYRYAWSIGGPFPTLVEWDADLPPLSDVLRELERAREARR